MNDSEITDIRPAKEFRQTSLSNYKKSDVKKSLITCISNKKIEESCYWSAELICAGHFIDVWEIILLYTSNHIHLGNPKLPIYLQTRYEAFKEIVMNGYVDNELKMRNNDKIRKLFAEIIAILCQSRKKHPFSKVKFDKNDFIMTNLSEKLKSPNVSYSF